MEVDPTSMEADFFFHRTDTRLSKSVGDRGSRGAYDEVDEWTILDELNLTDAGRTTQLAVPKCHLCCTITTATNNNNNVTSAIPSQTLWSWRCSGHQSVAFNLQSERRRKRSDHIHGRVISCYHGKYIVIAIPQVLSGGFRNYHKLV